MAIPNFGQMKDMYQLQKKAKQMQKELKELEIEAKSSDGLVAVVVSGEMKVVSISINEEGLKPEMKRTIETDIKDSIGQAMAKAQAESAARMQPLLKEMNIPGMG